MNNPKFNQAINKFARSMKKATPTVLSVVAIIGVAITAATTANATVKATKILAERNEPMTKTEVVKATWKCYIPPAIAAITTSACILSSAVLNAKQQASLAGAYTLIDSQFKEYKKKVKEIYGIEAHNKVLESIHAEKAKNPDLYVPSVWDTTYTTLDFGKGNEAEVEHLFYDELSERYFTSTLDKVLQAEYHLNRNMTLGMDITLNTWFTYLGLEKQPGGDDIGWSINDNYQWLDFDHYITTIDDNLECYVIEVVDRPDPNFGCA